MNQNSFRASAGQLPEIVHIVLLEAERRRRIGIMGQGEFERQMQRLVAEELKPRRLSLVVRKLPDGRTRFLIKESGSGKVRDMVESVPAAVAA